MSADVQPVDRIGKIKIAFGVFLLFEVNEYVIFLKRHRESGSWLM